MSYRIEQTDRYLGKDEWQWRAWIAATDNELDAIDHVIWRLHPTYAQPFVESRERVENFAIERVAWGRFQLGADIRFSDGRRVQRLRRQLQLWYPEDTAAPSKEELTILGLDFKRDRAQAGTPKVFLSYGTEDRNIAEAVAEALRKNGFAVSSPDEVLPGMPWQPALQKLSRESDLVLGIVSSEFASPNVVTELNNAHRAEKPILTLVSPGVGKVFGLDPGLSQAETDLADPKFEETLVGLVQKSLE